MTLKILPREKNIGWKIEEDGEILFTTSKAKIHALEKAEEIAEDTSEIQPHTIDGQKQDYQSWQQLISSYR